MRQSHSLRIAFSVDHGEYSNATTCMERCKNNQWQQCSATFSSNTSGEGDCTLSYTTRSTHQMDGPGPKIFIETFKHVLDTACLQLDGTFCLPMVSPLFRNLSGSPPTDGVLEGICSPCGAMIMESIFTDVGVKVGTDMMCTKVDSKFCFSDPAFSAMMASNDNAMMGSDDKVPAALCEHAACIIAVLSKFASISVNSTEPMLSPTDLIEAACSHKDGSAGLGKTCVQAMELSFQAMPPRFINVTTSCGTSLDATVCDTNCAAAVGGLIAAWGCCIHKFDPIMTDLMPFLTRCGMMPSAVGCGSIAGNDKSAMLQPLSKTATKAASAIAGTPKPSAIAGTPKPSAFAGTPKPSTIAGTPKPSAIAGTPMPSAIAGTPKPVNTKVQVKLSLIISIPPKDFTPSVQQTFKEQMAIVAGLPMSEASARVAIKYRQSGRRLLQDSGRVAVDVSISMPDTGTANKAVSMLTSNNINAQMAAVGLPDVTVTSRAIMTSGAAFLRPGAFVVILLLLLLSNYYYYY